MKLLAFTLLFVSHSLFSFDQFQLSLGANYNIPEAKDFRKENKPGAELGFITKFVSDSDYDFRTGLKFRRSTVSIKNDSIEGNWDLDYIDLPITIYNQLNETLSLIVGLKASYLVSNTCSIKDQQDLCEDIEVQSLYGQYIFGASEKVSDNLEAELLINSALTDIFEDTQLVVVTVSILYKI